jgi:endonuclease/exonuclease/phosphatase family metal-dependent hydrolase
MNFLFWNTAKRDVDATLLELLQAADATVVALAEYEGDATAVLHALRARGRSHVLVPNIACERITIFVEFSLSSVRHKLDSERFTIKEIRVPGSPPLLLVLLHLPSKLHLSEDDQLLRATNLREVIERIEREVGHSNTLVLGDFNMNPFDKGMVSAQGLNSVPAATTAQKGSRTIDGRTYEFFYNPCWNLLGDRNRPPGTYYHRSPSVLSHYWNTLDQVLLRPSIASRLLPSSLRTLTSAGATSLASADDIPAASDHLPIAFTLSPN